MIPAAVPAGARAAPGARSPRPGPPAPRLFTLPPGLDGTALAAQLLPLGGLDTCGARMRRRTWLDTFDWRLHRAGLLLEEEQAGARSRLRLRPAAGGRPLATQAGTATRLPRDLPRGPVRERLLPLVQPRALLPLAAATLREERFVLRAATGRPRARLTLLEGRLGPPQETPDRDLPRLLWVEGGRSAPAVAGALAAIPGAVPAAPDLAAAVLAPLGRAPREYSPKFRVALEPGIGAQEAARAILRRLLDAMEVNLPGLRADLDPEFLHDFRVAVRRTRAALGQIKGAFPEAALSRFVPEFRWLQEVTGPARDLDVFALAYQGLRALLPGRARRDLAALGRHLERRRAGAHREMCAALASPRLPRLLRSWRAYLARPVPRRPRGAPNARRPARDVAGARILRLLRRAVREGRGLGAAAAAADFHELRITCKKLRYLLEFFQGLFPHEEVRDLVATLKGLQDNLGAHQDLQVQQQFLEGLAREMAAAGRARPAAYLATGMLIERLRERQAAVRGEFAERFRAFARPQVRRRLRRLLRAPAPEARTGPPHGGSL